MMSFALEKIIRILLGQSAAVLRRNLGRSTFALRRSNSAGDTSLWEGEIKAIDITKDPLVVAGPIVGVLKFGPLAPLTRAPAVAAPPAVRPGRMAKSKNKATGRAAKPVVKRNRRPEAEAPGKILAGLAREAPGKILAGMNC